MAYLYLIEVSSILLNWIYDISDYLIRMEDCSPVTVGLWDLRCAPPTCVVHHGGPMSVRSGGRPMAQTSSVEHNIALYCWSVAQQLPQTHFGKQVDRTDSITITADAEEGNDHQHNVPCNNHIFFYTLKNNCAKCNIQAKHL